MARRVGALWKVVYLQFGRLVVGFFLSGSRSGARPSRAALPAASVWYNELARGSARPGFVAGGRGHLLGEGWRGRAEEPHLRGHDECCDR